METTLKFVHESSRLFPSSLSSEGIQFDRYFHMETPEQLSFDSLEQHEDNSTKLALIPYTDYHLINAKDFSFPKRRFFILSVVVHLLFAGYAVTIVVEKLTKPEVIEVTYDAPAPAAVPLQASYSQPEPPAIESTPVEPVVSESEPVVVVKPKSAPKPQAKAISKPAPAAKSQIFAAAVPAKTSSPAKTVSEAEPLATVSDIEIPALTAVSDEAAAAPSMKEIETDFDKIDEKQNEHMLAAAKVDTKLLEDSISELEESSKEVAQEPSELDALASERLNNLKQQKSELKKSQVASAGPVVHSTKAKTDRVNSAGNSENESASKVATTAGIGSQSEGIVRKLEDLKQKPGNPRPLYDSQDRKNGLSGTIIINAYVTKEGNLTLFRLIQSTGHRNLDRKTLSALKNWKFYPGQEGWVELPFKWDLKGGVQEDHARLRRVAR